MIQLLASAEFKSGNELAQHFNVTRTTIASWIEDLSEYGLDVHKVRGKGYRLSRALTLISKADLLNSLSDDVARTVKTVDVVLDTESTNKTALQSQHTTQGWQVYATEFQHAGRGRRGHDWLSPLGANLLFSLSSKRQWKLEVLYMASLIAGLSLARTLSDMLITEVKVKWPNDIYIGDHKVAGILCELQGSPQDESLLVVGMGVNVDASPVQIDRQAAALKQYLKMDIDRSRLLALIVSGVIRDIDQANSGGIDGVLDDWSAFDYLAGREIKIVQGSNVFEGRAIGIDSQGQLLLENNAGSVSSFNAGEVTVRWS